MSSTTKALELCIDTERKQEITKQSLRKLHSEQMFCGNDNKENILEIVEILGGINCILDKYLNEENNIKISNDELLRLNEILITPKQEKVSLIKQKKSRQCIEIFDINDTVLSSMTSPLISQNIRNVIYHKITLILIIMAAIIGQLLLGTLVFVDPFIFNIYWITLYCLYIICLIFAHLTMNKKALILCCMKSFDFWIKVFYGTMFSVARLFHGGAPVTEYGFTLSNIRDCFFGIMAILLISYIGAFDAVNTDKKKKFALSIFCALYFCFFAIYFTFFDPKKYDYEIAIKLTNTTLSIKSLLSSSTRILCLFFSKQAFNTLRNKNGGAISISHSPRIIWIDSKINKNDDIMVEEKEDKIDIFEQEEKEEISFENISTKKYRTVSLRMDGVNNEEEIEKIYNRSNKNVENVSINSESNENDANCDND